MCIGSSAPAPIPQPPAPTPPPPEPTPADKEVRKSKAKSRQVAALASGREGTLLGGQLTDTPSNQPAKTLLGA
jgi:hypothetical protein